MLISLLVLLYKVAQATDRNLENWPRGLRDAGGRRVVCRACRSVLVTFDLELSKTLTAPDRMSQGRQMLKWLQAGSDNRGP